MIEGKQTFEQITLPFPLFTGKMEYGIMYGMLGSMVPQPFHLYPSISLQAFCSSWRFVSIICLLVVYMLTTEHMCALRCPFGKAYFYKGGALQDYGNV